MRARLSTAAAAARVSVTLELWESWEDGLTEMNPTLWVRFLEATGQDEGIDL